MVVLYECETAKKFHQELFSLPNEGYYAIEGAVTDAVVDASRRCTGELHISAQWETIVLLACCSPGIPTVRNVLALLGEPVTDSAHAGLEPPDIRGIFFSLCRRERFDLLRRICKTAKAKAESMCGERIRVHCHLVSDEAQKIIASSL